MKIEYPVVDGSDYIKVEYIEDYHMYQFLDSMSCPVVTSFSFHTGEVENGIFNGLTIESLLAVCKHRLETHQKTEFSCMENDVAINHIRQAIEILNQRTAERIQQEI